MYDGSREIASRADTYDGSRERLGARCIEPPRGEMERALRQGAVPKLGPSAAALEESKAIPVLLPPPPPELPVPLPRAAASLWSAVPSTEPFASVLPAPPSIARSSTSNGVVGRELEVELDMAPPSEAPSRALYGPPIACIAGVLHAAGNPALATAPCTGCTGLKPSAH